MWPDIDDRTIKLDAAFQRIQDFRTNYVSFLELNARARVLLATEIGNIYRDCQHLLQPESRKLLTAYCESYFQVGTNTYLFVWVSAFSQA